MGESRSEIATAAHNTGPAKSALATKRMMLSEVYVHKTRRLNDDPQTEDKFDVFHIYEFDDNSNVKISPKLSTNCTEPRKIIDVLRNSTGSETPQLQRLIEKLCAQNKKWSEMQDQNSNKNNSGANGSVTNESNGNKAPTTNDRPMAPPASTQPNLRITQATDVQTRSSTGPMIRLKAIESLKEPTVASVQKAYMDDKHHTYAKKAPPTQKRNNNGTVSKPVTAASATNKPAPAVKLWNNVIQNNVGDKDEDYLIVANKEDSNNESSSFCLKPAEEMIENAPESDSSSSLKIQQVFECVTDEFVEDLLEKSTNATSRPTAASGPHLDNLPEDVVDKQSFETPNDSRPNNGITFVPSSNTACIDFRCNICLVFNENYNDYTKHMMNAHQCIYVCSKCHEGFRSDLPRRIHFGQNGKCTRPENAQRTFICIVDPPVVLMKNGKVFAFKCKHCNLGFNNQRNYVQHAQRHAKNFRCKLCPTASVMSTALMQAHLKYH